MVLFGSMTEREGFVSHVQPSLSEWFQAIGHVDAEVLQVEDVGKRNRLDVLRQFIGIDYDRVTSFPATDFYAHTPHVEDILQAIRVTDPEVQARLCDELDSEFTSEGFLVGYFETLLWPTKLIFIDYNRKLHEMLELPVCLLESADTQATVKGISASVGKAEGTVRIVSEADLGTIEFNQGDILVTDNTDVRFLPLMRKAGAIVTDRGGMLSHAAITARELGVPSVVGCKDATKKLSDGQRVRIDATRGVISVEVLYDL